MIEGTVPCSICGEYPILEGSRSARLVCPNYKSEKIQHGNLCVDTKGIPMGFTKRNYNFWTEEQKIQTVKELVKEWNNIHMKD